MAGTTPGRWLCPRQAGPLAAQLPLKTDATPDGPRSLPASPAGTPTQPLAATVKLALGAGQGPGCAPPPPQGKQKGPGSERGGRGRQTENSFLFFSFFEEETGKGRNNPLCSGVYRGTRSCGRPELPAPQSGGFFLRTQRHSVCAPARLWGPPMLPCTLSSGSPL